MFQLIGGANSSSANARAVSDTDLSWLTGHQALTARIGDSSRRYQ